MPIIEFTCNDCGRLSSDLFGMTVQPGEMVCKGCGSANTERVMSQFVGKIAAWMTDEAMSRNSRQREWLKTPAAKAMDLSIDRSDDPDPGGLSGDQAFGLSGGPSADEVFARAVAQGSEEAGMRLIADVCGDADAA